MAEDAMALETGAEQVVFAATEHIPIRFSDAFLVAGGDDIFTLNFYQTEIPQIQGAPGDSAPMQRPPVHCFARIAVTPIGLLRLATSMAHRAGYDLVKREGESTQ